MASKDKALDLNSDITELKGFGPKKAELLKKLGLFRLRDMLYYYPRGYEDRRNVKQISALNNEERALVKAKVLLVSPGMGLRPQKDA